jgi:hypothetical protein
MSDASIDTHKNICNFGPSFNIVILAIKIERQGKNETCLYGFQKKCPDIRKAFSSIFNTFKAFLKHIIEISFIGS